MEPSCTAHMGAHMGPIWVPYRLLAGYYTRHMHSLPYRQIHKSVCYYRYSFSPMSSALWNKLRVPADLVLVSDLDSFKTGVSKISQKHP